MITHCQKAIAMLCLFMLNICTTALAQTNNLTTELNKVIDQAISEQRIVGTVVLVSKQGQLIYHRAAGMADREQNKPMTEQSIFRLASVSKAIVTIAALKLIEEQKIHLNDTVTKWLPDFKPQLKDGSTPTITIQQLLTHTAGLNYGFFEPANGPYHKAKVSDGLDQPGLSMEENLKRIASVPLLYAPGSSWNYSLSIDVLGAVLSKATNQPLPQVIEIYVTKPLQMLDTAFIATEPTRLTTAYKDGKPAPVKMQTEDSIAMGEGKILFTPDRYLNQASFSSGGAGMLGTAPDFMKLLQILHNKGKPILSNISITQMLTNQVEGTIPMLGEGWGFGFGGALIENPQQTGTPYSKNTLLWGGVYGHSWFYDPVKDIAVVIFTNTALEGMSGQFPDDIRDTIYRNQTTTNQPIEK